VAQNATQLPRDGDDDDVDDNDDEEEKETKMSAMESSGEQKMIPSKQRLGFYEEDLKFNLKMFASLRS